MRCELPLYYITFAIRCLQSSQKHARQLQVFVSIVPQRFPNNRIKCNVWCGFKDDNVEDSEVVVAGLGPMVATITKHGQPQAAIFFFLVNQCLFVIFIVVHSFVLWRFIPPPLL